MQKLAIKSITPYGCKYTTTFKAAEIIGSEENPSLFSNIFVQRSVNVERADRIAKDYLKILTSDHIEDSIPFQSSMIASLQLKQYDVKVDDRLYFQSFLTIPGYEGILSIRDGGHRTYALREAATILTNKIENVKGKNIKNKYIGALEQLKNIDITMDIYINLDDETGKRCLIDVGKSRPMAQGREFVFLFENYDKMLETFYEKNSEELKKPPFKLCRDYDKWSKKIPFCIPICYVKKLVKDYSEALTLYKLSEDEIHFEVKGFLQHILDNLKYTDTMALDKIRKEYFEKIKKQINEKNITIRNRTIAQLYPAKSWGHLNESQREDIRQFMYENYDLREIISEIKKECITDVYKINLRNKNDEENE